MATACLRMPLMLPAGALRRRVAQACLDIEGSGTSPGTRMAKQSPALQGARRPLRNCFAEGFGGELDELAGRRSPSSSWSQRSDLAVIVDEKPRIAEAKRVSFGSPLCCASHEVTPYAELYGLHPGKFDFDASGAMVLLSPASSLSTPTSSGCSSSLSSPRREPLEVVEGVHTTAAEEGANSAREVDHDEDAVAGRQA
eukprot:TRINITY_DN20463_c0_g1_i2.p1 TRINITY_DN20463_c0_g1~~TRINITY_DN20463_c0_g1_i2.p1  ORF type:complete len:223 (-),score=34.65 TRINITY_DN20463_c0_g1_i2:129-722(-)